MSIKAYVGRMGSGKSYEVVSSVLIGALSRGRRVVTNISGLDYEAICDYILAKDNTLTESNLGQLAIVSHEKILEAIFWRTDTDIDRGVDSFIQPGDLVALDEVWRFWQGFATKDGDGKKRPEQVMNFFRTHRHFTHPVTGVSCDVVLITQDIMDLSRTVRAVIEETYRMEKLTAIGSAKRYRVDIFTGGSCRSLLRQLQRSYDPAIFPLYSSHSQRKEGDAVAKEENIDGRGNVLKGALFTIILPLGLLLIAASIYYLYGFFHPVDSKVAIVDSSTSTVKTDQSRNQSSSELNLSSVWRIHGWFKKNGLLNVVLVNSSNFRRLIQPPNWKLTGDDLEIMLPTGEIVTSWTGQGGFVDQVQKGVDK